MNVNQIAERFKNELPGYKLVGYTELGFPVFQCILHCLMLNDAQIPVIEEFVLNFYNQGIELSEIASILGLDFELIEEAWIGLLQRDYINPVTKEISSFGNDYLKEHKIDKLEKSSVHVSIDGLTGTMKPKSSQLMANKNAKKLGIRTIRSVIDKPNVESIDFIQVKNVIKEYQKIDKENYNGRILEVFHVEGQATKYKRLYVLAYINNDNNVRFLVYDGMERLEGYENALMQLEDRGVSVFKYSLGKYFDSDKINLINAIIAKNMDELYTIEPGKIWELWNEYLGIVEKDAFIVLPLVDMCTPSDFWIESLSKVLERGTKITIIISGREFVSTYQKEQIEEIIKLKRKFKNLKLSQVPEYYNRILIIDDCKGIISSYNKYDLNSNSSKVGIVEYGYIMSQHDIHECMKKLSSVKILNIKKVANLTGVDSKWLNDKMRLITQLVSDFDNRLYMVNNIGWIGDGPIPETQTLLNVPLAKNHEMFKTFINALNKSLVESIEVNGKSNGIKSYFWSDIKNNYPSLHRTLHKIKVYRNNADHLVLDEQNKELYYQFLEEDLEGRMPEFVDNGFLMLQVKIIDELEQNIRSLL